MFHHRFKQFLFVVVCVLSTSTVWAYYVPGEFEVRTGAAQRERNYNIRLGDLQLDLAARARVSFDDNFHQASAGGQSAATIEYGLDTGLYWPISRGLRLDVTMYFGHIMTSGAEGVDGFVIRTTESTSIALDMRVGDNGLLSFLDTLTTNIGSFEFVPGEPVGRLWQLQNDAALQYEHQLDKTKRLALRAGRVDLFSLNDDFKNRNRVSQYVSGRLPWRPARDHTFFPYFRYVDHYYPREEHNDAVEYEFGGGWLWQATPRTRLELTGGYQSFDFDTDNVPEATEQVSGGTGKAVVLQQLTRHINHAGTLKYYRRLGNASRINYNTDLVFSYRLNWGFSRRWDAQYLVQWLKTWPSYPSGTSEVFINHELQLTYRFDDLWWYVAYGFSSKSSSLADRDFSGNHLTFGVYYDF